VPGAAAPRAPPGSAGPRPRNPRRPPRTARRRPTPRPPACRRRRSRAGRPAPAAACPAGAASPRRPAPPPRASARTPRSRGRRGPLVSVRPLALLRAAAVVLGLGVPRLVLLALQAVRRGGVLLLLLGRPLGLPAVGPAGDLLGRRVLALRVLVPVLDVLAQLRGVRLLAAVPVRVEDALVVRSARVARGDRLLDEGELRGQLVRVRHVDVALDLVGQRQVGLDQAAFLGRLVLREVVRAVERRDRVVQGPGVLGARES